MELGGFIAALFMLIAATFCPIWYVCHRMLGSIRASIERKIDDATDYQNNDLARKIKVIQIDVNDIKSEIKTLRTMAALINRTPLPDCMGGKWEKK